MMNYGTEYRVEGTSALNAAHASARNSCAIIPFPQKRESPAMDRVCAQSSADAQHAAHYDDAMFSQLDRKSEALLGALFTSVATLIVLLGLL